MKVHSFLDKNTETYTHLLIEKNTQQCTVFDPVLDYNAHAGSTSTQSADDVIQFIQQHDLTLTYIIETHAHADHLTSAPYIKSQLGGQIVIGKDIVIVQKVFKNIFNFDASFKTDASQFDILTKDGDTLKLGGLNIRAIHVPGHTPADMAYIVTDASDTATDEQKENIAIFAGDTIFASDVGTARCDFPGGNAETLYDSIQTLLSQPDHAKIYLCHDYPPADETGKPLRDYQSYTTVAEEKQNNKHVKQGISKAEFVAMRTERDNILDMPRLIIPSVQVNVDAGHLPEPASNGVRYLKVPLNTLGQA